jgi:glycosyltransferase involved in cell wall biosynthesis
LEAMRCGTPVIVNNSSSNKEIFNGNGSLFTRKEQLIEKISKINLSNLKYSRNNLLNILPVEQAYLQFIKKIFKRKKLSLLNYIILKIYVFFLFKK